ncbi:MAG: PKD domain-containing protein, partial [Flavobacteriales bacterium]|nr:PKD domain-containing protein [Flavobacteriales bacterium]
VGATDATANGRNKQKAYHNYFLGNDRNYWKGRVPLYGGVHMENLYPGIHLEAKSKKGALKYDIIVEQGADPSAVRMEYTGLDHISIADGKLMLHTSLGTLEEHIPLAWQEIDGRTVVVPCTYTLDGSVAAFDFPEGYDRNAPLIIDPVLVAATLSGTTLGSNWGHGATYDVEGNIFTHAISFMLTNYPVTEGAFQTTKLSTAAVLTKFNPDASDLIWASYLGGNQPTYPHSAITNNQGELYVYGTTSAPDFPVTANAAQQNFGGDADIYVTRFNMDGTALLGSTYIGGSSSDGQNNTSSFGHDGRRGEIMVDPLGNAYVATATRSNDFPTTPGSFQTDLQGPSDGVVVKLNANMSTVIWSTLLGGTGAENCSGLRVADNGNVVVTGMTNSTNFPMPAGGYQENKNPGYDAFIVELNADGSALTKGTFAGTPDDDYAFFIDQNVTGISIYGISLGDWPVTDGAYDTGGRTFVTRFSNDLTEMTHSARIANTSGSLVAFMVDLCGRSYMSMYNVAGGGFLELTDDALFTNGGFYIAVLDENLEELTFGTMGPGSHVDGGTSRFDRKGIIYQGVCSGSGTMQGTPGAWAVGQNAPWDIGVFKIDFSISTTLAAGTVPNPTGCVPHEVEFENFSSGTNFSWDFGDGSPPSEETNPTHAYEQPGTYEVVLIATDSTSCNLSDTTSLFINVGEPFDFESGFDYLYDCASLGLELINLTSPTDTFLVYNWNMGDGTVYSDFEPVHQYDGPGDYTVTLTVTNPLCSEEGDTTTVEIPVYPDVEADLQADVVDYCVDATVAFANEGTGATSTFWDFGDGNSGTGAAPEYTYASPGTYTVTLIASNPQSCNLADTVVLEVVIPPLPDLQATAVAQQTGNCADLGFIAESTTAGNVESYVWIFEGDTIGTANPVEGNIGAAGVYEITLIVTEDLCGTSSDTTVTVELINNMGSALQPEYTLCYHDDSVEITAASDVEGATYFWLPGGEDSPEIVASKPGTFEVVITAGTCVDSLQTMVSDGNPIPTQLHLHRPPGVQAGWCGDF